MDRLRKAYLGALTAKQAAGLEKQPDDYIAESACVLCAGFLVVLEDDAKARRKVIESAGNRATKNE
jgi:hypothetical protein